MTTVSNISLEELVAPSSYDTSLSRLYKEAIRIGVPVKFLLIRPGNELKALAATSFDLENWSDGTSTYPEPNFMTTFVFIRELLLEDNELSVTQIWEFLSEFDYNPLELVPMWLHAIPEYRSEQAAQNSSLLQQVRVFMQNLGEPFEAQSMADIINYYQSVWLPKYQEEYQRDVQTLQEYVSAQEEISGITPLSHSGLTIDTVVITYDYQVAQGVNPLPDIFNSSVSSYLAPFIQYNIKPIKGNADKIERFYKVYKGKSLDTRPDYNKTVLLSDQASRSETIYLNVWQGTDYYDPDLGTETNEAEEEARTGTKGGFGKVSISLINEVKNSTLIRVRFMAPQTDQVNEETIMRRIHNHIPGLTMPGTSSNLPDILTGQPESIEELQVSGGFIIYNINLVELIFFDLVMNDPLFSSYLYLEESGKSFAEKTRLNIHYRGAATDVSVGGKEAKRKSSVSATINEQMIKAGEKFFISSENRIYTAQEDFPILDVKITRASSRRIASQFLDVLARLFRRYIIEGDTILNRYLTLVPSYQDVIALKEQAATPEEPARERSVRGSGRTVQRLQSLAPDIFVVGWARDCQPVSRQPKPISPEEIPYWKNQQIQTSQGLEQRQIMGFPKDRHQVILVCPDDREPYPGVRQNKKGKNKDIYPYLPCCFNKNQMARPNTNLNRYLRGELKPKAKSVPPGHIMTTDKLLEPERVGEIHTTVSSFLKRYDEQEAGNFLRYGVTRSYNSFIHCIALARGIPEYFSATDREEWANQFRANLFNMSFPSRQAGISNYEQLYPEALRQELYDMNNQNIIEKAVNEDEFFDPLLFYRALELIFDCNIYIFSLIDQDHDRGLKTSLLQLPRSKYFHAHPPSPDKPVVLVLRYWGSESNALTYPQCELIVDRQQDETVMQFGNNMNILLYPALTFVGRTISWQIYENGERLPIMSSRLNIYSAINYNLLFGNIPIIGQVIDNAGKARMFALAPEYNPDTQSFSPLRIFVNVLPTAPLNVREFSPVDVSNELPPYQKTIELFGNPTSATVSTDQRYLTGLWFPMGDIQYGFYCPCTAISWTSVQEQYSDLNTTSEMSALTVNIPRDIQMGESPIQRIRLLTRAAKFINQIVKYLYLLADKPRDIFTFLTTIGLLISSEQRPDSLQLYKVSDIPRILPLPQSNQNPVESVLTQLARINPTMFYNNKLLIYDQQMLEGLSYQLTHFQKEIEGIPFEPTRLRQLQNYYDQKSAFNFNPESEFLLGTLREFNVWMNTYVPSPSLPKRTIQNLKQNIQSKLNPNAFFYQEPYIFQRSDNRTPGSSYNPMADRFYLIQNVAGGNFRRAINVAYTWFTERRNTGFTTEPYEGPEPSRPQTGEPLSIEAPVTEDGEPAAPGEQEELQTTIVPKALGNQALTIQSPPSPQIGGVSPVRAASQSGLSNIPSQPGPIVSLGRNPIVSAPVLPAHIIHRISPGGGIIIELNNSNVDPAQPMPLALEILNYGNNTYAAMLPIL
jgi:hypothetical protein